MEIIMPCAGLSTRFPNMRPKYLLTDYSGKMMIESAIKNFLGKHKIIITILRAHDEKYKASQKLKDAFGDKVSIVVLGQPTAGPADTVYQTLMTGAVNMNSPILIKDCDGFYDADLVEGNAIYVSKLSENPDIRNAPAKSYTITNEQNIISSVVEKKIVSDSFCVGGYQFSSAANFAHAYTMLTKTWKSEIFVSNIIDYMISTGSVFVEQNTRNFIDVGTADDWFKFNDKPTYFCDIDGTIIKNQIDYYDVCEPIIENIDKLLEKMNEGCKIIFCTARNKKYELMTRSLLHTLGFTDCELIMEVHHSKRILINDYAQSNPYPTAVAVNIPRDSDQLKDLI